MMPKSLVTFPFIHADVDVAPRNPSSSASGGPRDAGTADACSGVGARRGDFRGG